MLTDLADTDLHAEVRMIDWERVNTFCDEVGADDFDEVVALFLDEVEDVINRLHAVPDLTTLEDDLHFLKGSALGLGFRSFSALCQAGETLSAQGKAAEVNLKEILENYAASKQCFQAEMPQSMTN